MHRRSLIIIITTAIITITTTIITIIQVGGGEEGDREVRRRQPGACPPPQNSIIRESKNCKQAEPESTAKQWAENISKRMHDVYLSSQKALIYSPSYWLPHYIRESWMEYSSVHHGTHYKTTTLTFILKNDVCCVGKIYCPSWETEHKLIRSLRFTRGCILEGKRTWR